MGSCGEGRLADLRGGKGREIPAGGFEGGEESAGEAEVDLVGGDASRYLADGALEFFAGGGGGEGEVVAGADLGAGFGAEGPFFCAELVAVRKVAAGGLVVEAERLAAEGGRVAGAGWRGGRGGNYLGAEDADVVLAGRVLVVRVIRLN